MITCKHCGRILTNPVYEYLEEGAICRETHRHERDEKTRGSKDNNAIHGITVSLSNNVFDNSERNRFEEKMF